MKSISAHFNRLNTQQFNTIWWGVAVLFVAAGIVAMTAPAEATLGNGIRTVYVHVGLTWAGTAVFLLTAILGLLVMFTSSRYLHDWMRPAGWVATAFYAAGVGMSMIASKVNWGAVFLQEPRMAAAINTLGIAVLIQIGASWFPWLRLRGFLNVVFIVLLYWVTYLAPLVLHPKDAASSSASSSGIRVTFLVLFGLFLAAALMTIWQLRHRMMNVKKIKQ
ncbi:MAG: hypothetical protein DWQ04_04565 [Chloroflexi bacterium]|nr:MAG: hypothetical protein DWQ04_04565 [Chloroflexota bacterium]